MKDYREICMIEYQKGDKILMTMCKAGKDFADCYKYRPGSCNDKLCIANCLNNDKQENLNLCKDSSNLQECMIGLEAYSCLY